MPSIPARFTAAALLAAVLAAPGAAPAADLEVSPVGVELSANVRTAMVTIRNTGASSMRYQIRAYDWSQRADGELQLVPATDLVLFPPLVELAPGESRNVRVGTERAPGERERSWRMFVEELPRKDARGSGATVQVLTRVGLPVFLSPQKRVDAAEITFLPRAGARLRFAVRNTGTVRVKPESVTLRLVSADGRPVLERAVDAWYVLAGGERVFEVEVPPDACAGAPEAVVTAILAARSIEARAPGACRDP